MPEMKLVIDGKVLADILRSPAGPVGRHLIERGTAVQARAKQILAPHRKSGCLEDSLVKRMETNGVELALRLVSDTTPCSPTRQSYSLAFHNGSAPHDIYPRNAQALAFPWQGGVGIFAHVHHPGFAGVPFLTEALKVL